MPRRRFGKTELDLPIISLGGMRHMHSWRDLKRTPKTSQANVEAVLHRAFAMGINHFETARGYGTSELEMGRFLADFPRDQIIVMTKAGPRANPDDFARQVDECLTRLRLDRLDLFAMHGLNDAERVRWTLKRGGCLKVVERLRDQGVIDHIGFSTHAPLDIILEALNSEAFEFVNLHFYHFNQRHWPAVQRAHALDMGVFIISPQDKGGMLYRPSEKLREATRPLHPMTFNQLWTLSHPEVHTLSFGASKTSELASLRALMREFPRTRSALRGIPERVERTMHRALGETWCSHCHECLPCPEGINIPEALRLRNLLRGLDMKRFAKMRYNIFESAGHWFPGNKATACTECGDCLPRCPEKLEIPRLLFDLHESVAGEKVKRLGSH
jgi:hypothetical protein